MDVAAAPASGAAFWLWKAPLESSVAPTTTTTTANADIAPSGRLLRPRALGSGVSSSSGTPASLERISIAAAVRAQRSRGGSG